MCNTTQYTVIPHTLHNHSRAVVNQSINQSINPSLRDAIVHSFVNGVWGWDVAVGRKSRILGQGRHSFQKEMQSVSRKRNRIHNNELI